MSSLGLATLPYECWFLLLEEYLKVIRYVGTIHLEVMSTSSTLCIVSFGCLVGWLVDDDDDAREFSR